MNAKAANTRLEQNRRKHMGKTYTNLAGLECVVIGYDTAQKVTVKFIESGYIKTAIFSNIKAGKVGDNSRKQNYNIVGTVRKNSKEREYLIVAKKGEGYVIRFLLTNYERWVPQTRALDGQITDRFVRDTYGVGYLGGQDWNVPYYAKGKQVWKEMLRRCYSPDFRPTGNYVKAVVSEEWQNLSIFLNDIKELKGFDRWLNGETMHLDKDLLGNSLLYSRDACIFLTPEENRQEQTERYSKK